MVLAISKEPNRVGASLPSPGDCIRFSFPNVVFSSYLEFRTMDRVHNLSDSECSLLWGLSKWIFFILNRMTQSGWTADTWLEDSKIKGKIAKADAITSLFFSFPGLFDLLASPNLPYAFPLQEFSQTAPQIQTAHCVFCYGNSSGGDCTHTVDSNPAHLCFSCSLR
jgi:hypothetical protein